MISSPKVLRNFVLGGVASALLLAGMPAKAEIFLVKKEKPTDWEVSTNGRVDAYLNWLTGETINAANSGNPVPSKDPTMPSIDRYTLVGPQIQLKGNATPSGAVASATEDKTLNTFRIRGGFASTILAFNIYKQILPDVKLTVKLALWAGIQNGLNGGVRQFNDSASVDFREQYMDLSGSWGAVWGGRRIGLFNRGGMKMDWWLIHQHGVGHPCDVDSSAAATCGHTGVGSMFPARHAQLGYATPNLGGLQLSVAALDPAMIDQLSWNRTIAPRFEGELVFHKDMTDRPVGKDEINVWANGLWQMIGRTGEQVPRLDLGDRGIPADSTRSVWGGGGGVWGRFIGFGLGATGWYGKGLGTAWALGNTAIDSVGQLRTHFGYLAAANYRISDWEVAASYGSTNVKETGWDASPVNPIKLSVVKEVRGIGYKLAYRMDPVVFSIDGMILRYTWHRGEVQNANTVSAGMLAEW